MAVYFKYKSAKDYDSIPVVDPFITVGILKLKIFESKRFGKGKDFDLIVSNAHTNEEYVDEHTLIPRNTSVLIRRVPGLPQLPIVLATKVGQPQPQPQVESDSSTATNCHSECVDEFGDDVYAIPKLNPTKQVVVDAPICNNSLDREEEERKIKSSVDTPALVQSSNGYGGFGWKKPPVGYVCHRCNVPGHYIQHCPTGDLNYDIKKVKPTVSITGEAAFSKEVEGLSSLSKHSSSSDIPPELFCQICTQVMKDAVIASKCCFSSFCDKCIRDHIMSNSKCFCGARNILADTLLPNLTVRKTITKYMESSSSNSVKNEVVTTTTKVQDMASSHSGQTKIPGTYRREECVSESRKRAAEAEQQKPGDTKKLKKSDSAAAAAGGHMVPMSTASYNTRWNGMQYMNYGVPFVSSIPQGDLADRFLPQDSFRRRQYFEASKAGLKRKREMSRDFPSAITC